VADAAARNDDGEPCVGMLLLSCVGRGAQGPAVLVQSSRLVTGVIVVSDWLELPVDESRQVTTLFTLIRRDQ
jgi:hypothetical protein